MKPIPYFSGNQLKWIAIFAMFLDHAAKTVFSKPIVTFAVPYSSPPNQLLSFFQSLAPTFIIVGRLAFPIFCFLLVEGFQHTSNRKKYLLHLFLFALISEIPYDLAFSGQLFDFSSQNVFFTLLLGLLVLMSLEKMQSFTLKNSLLSLLSIGVGLFLGEYLNSDYGGKIGVLLIVSLYLLRNYRFINCLIGSLIIIQNSFFGIFAFVLLFFYNGQRGKQWKYFFYWFYPVHLFVLFGLHYLILRWT